MLGEISSYDLSVLRRPLRVHMVASHASMLVLVWHHQHNRHRTTSMTWLRPALTNERALRKFVDTFRFLRTTAGDGAPEVQTRPSFSSMPVFPGEPNFPSRFDQPAAQDVPVQWKRAAPNHLSSMRFGNLHSKRGLGGVLGLTWFLRQLRTTNMEAACTRTSATAWLSFFSF